MHDVIIRNGLVVDGTGAPGRRADVAISGGETISDLLTQMKEKMLAAQDTSLTVSDRAALSADYVALRKQIDLAASSASFNGVSLISSGSSGNVRALANANATSSIDVDHVDLSTTGALLSGTLADHGIVINLVYHPADRFWLFQGLETALFLALAAGLLGLTYWCVTRRLA